MNPMPPAIPYIMASCLLLLGGVIFASAVMPLMGPLANELNDPAPEATCNGFVCNGDLGLVVVLLASAAIFWGGATLWRVATMLGRDKDGDA